VAGGTLTKQNGLACLWFIPAERSPAAMHNRRRAGNCGSRCPARTVRLAAAVRML